MATTHLYGNINGIHPNDGEEEGGEGGGHKHDRPKEGTSVGQRDGEIQPSYSNRGDGCSLLQVGYTIMQGV